MGYKKILAVSATALLPLTASAQNTSLGQPIQVQDVLTFSAGLTLDQNSNVFLVDDSVSDAVFAARYGDTSRGDTVLTGQFGVKFDRDFSLQRITATGTIRPQKHINYSQFDNVGYDAGVNWDWAVGRPWFGKVGIRLRQSLSDFNDVQQDTKNLQRFTNFYLTAGMRLTPSWAILTGFDSDKLDNSTQAQAASDRRFTGTELGVRFAPGTGTELDLVYRRTSGDYPNRQLFDALGQPLLTNGGVDNGFSENAILARLQYKPNEDTTLSGELGYTRRSYDNFADRDFSGPTARLTMDWRPGGAFFMGVDLIRDIGAEELLTANYVDLTELRLRPTFRLTGKTSLAGLVSFQNRDYGGDPRLVTTNAPVREDKLTRFGITANWQYSRNILFTLGLRREARSSNYNGLDYDNNVLSIGGQINL